MNIFNLMVSNLQPVETMGKTAEARIGQSGPVISIRGKDSEMDIIYAVVESRRSSLLESVMILTSDFNTASKNRITTFPVPATTASLRAYIKNRDAILNMLYNRKENKDLLLKEHESVNLTSENIEEYMSANNEFDESGKKKVESDDVKSDEIGHYVSLDEQLRIAKNTHSHHHDKEKSKEKDKDREEREE